MSEKKQLILTPKDSTYPEGFKLVVHPASTEEAQVELINRLTTQSDDEWIPFVIEISSAKFYNFLYEWANELGLELTVLLGLNAPYNGMFNSLTAGIATVTITTFEEELAKHFPNEKPELSTDSEEYSADDLKLEEDEDGNEQGEG